jgi:protocatechuate 3,4-dioxygenase beta subunit
MEMGFLWITEFAGGDSPRPAPHKRFRNDAYMEVRKLGLIKNIADRIFTGNKNGSASTAKQELLRRCYFEVMEQRRVLSADPVIAAVTYLEGDSGQDTSPDHFEVSFEGGSEATQLTQFTINGDQDQSGDLSDGDMFFDVDDQQPGTADHHAFQFDAANSAGVQASDIQSVSVSADGLSLIVNVDNFEAGDVFAFTIDVDEVERFRTDKIASGVEFEGTFFDAQFVDANYTFEDMSVSVLADLKDGFIQPQQEGIFYDEYDQLFDEGESFTNDTLNLNRDNETLQQNRTAAAIDAYQLEPKPITIEGNVFHDENTDCVHDGSEDGIAGVQIDLQRLNESTGAYETVAQTVTDADGHYEFGEDLDLRPGVFRLVQTQPEDYLDVGTTAGSEGGSVSQNVIGEIDIPLGGTAATNYNFCEVRPASISGNVWHDENNDGNFDDNEDGIANVLIRVTRVGAKSGVTSDAFADTDPVFVRTDANGHYSVEQLPPGIYEVVEINNYPESEFDPLAEFIDGKDAVGNIDGVTVGSKTNDRFANVELCADDHGVEYNFGELKAASISGNVSVATPGSDPNDPTDPLRDPIQGVTIELYDGDGTLIDTTLTDADGNYEFVDLAPGVYSVVEVQPDGYLDASDHLGNVDGQTRGDASENDRFTGIVLGSGDEGVRYDFCEHIPAEICGTVYHDRNNNGVQDAGEEGIEGVRMTLTDADGNVIAESFTDAAGDYCFVDLLPGEYCVKEFQPDDFNDGIDSVGTVDGRQNGDLETNDKITKITLVGGDRGVDYDFGELREASISGRVHVDSNGNCDYETGTGDELLSGVTLELLDSNGDVIATTITDAAGQYTFGDLAPGTYSVRQLQPDGLFSGGEFAGSNGGLSTENLLSTISVSSGDAATNYDFCEHQPAALHGRVWEDGPAIETEDGQPVEGYRGLRDAIYTAGTDTPLEGVRMQLYFFRTADSIVPQAVTLGDVLPEFYSHLGTTDPSAEVWVETGADGQYWFRGLEAGNYIVIQEQPEGLFDSTDVVGTTTGFTFNDPSEVGTAPESLISTFGTSQILDAVSNIRIEAGGISQFNNFTEVRFASIEQPPEPPSDPPPLIPPGNPTPPLTNPNPLPPGAGLTAFPGLLGAQTPARSMLGGNTRGLFDGDSEAGGGGFDSYTWHLSVVNAGQPRSMMENQTAEDSVWTQVGHLQNSDWNRFDMNDAVWTFTTTDETTGVVSETDTHARFGVIDGTPLAGDFDGDGIDEVAIFKDGYWMIDINHNGNWDNNDLLARLGDSSDRPVVGDWDGDGKDDIGIYGPIWERDLEAIERDPGLPNPDNDPYSTPKNVPPVDQHATNGARVMQLTSNGSERADVVDHVFGTGTEEQVPVTGDWNGNGIRSIGTFENGEWNLDVDGDGRFTSDDVTAQFGRAGDIPLVGDFDGDGVEEIAIYRAGTWMVDSNGNRELDATDRTFQMGTEADLPVVGDWDGDGVDEPALYREAKMDDFN